MFCSLVIRACGLLALCGCDFTAHLPVLLCFSENVQLWNRMWSACVTMVTNIENSDFRPLTPCIDISLYCTARVGWAIWLRAVSRHQLLFVTNHKSYKSASPPLVCQNHQSCKAPTLQPQTSRCFHCRVCVCVRAVGECGLSQTGSALTFDPSGLWIYDS